MATLKLPAGRKHPQKSPQVRTLQIPIRQGHAAPSTYFDQFRKRKTRPEDVPIRRSNTPMGRANFARRTLSAEQFKPTNQQLSDLYLPNDVQLAHAVNIVRKDLGLRPDRLAHPVGIVDSSRLKPVKRQAPRISQMERGDTPFDRKVLRLLRKVGII